MFSWEKKTPGRAAPHSGQQFNIPTVTDIHEASDAAKAAAYVDVLQIPAFLVRQTDLVVAAAKTGKVVNLKKGQFMSPESMQFAVQKVKDSGNDAAWITDRGTQFGCVEQHSQRVQSLWPARHYLVRTQ